MFGPTQKEKADAFRALHHGQKPLVLPNAWDAGTAVMVAGAGFPAVATTSAGVAFALGHADGENITRDDMLDVVSRIAARVDVPVTADIEAGFGATPGDVGETVRLVIEAGAVGVNLEDGLDHAAGTVRDLDDAVARIAAARAAAETAGVPLVINARTDVYFDRAAEAQQNFDAAVARANAYLSAGADCAFVIAVMEADAIARLVAALDGPLNIIAGSAGLDIGALSAMGVRRISLASGLSRVAFGAFAAALAEVREAGTLSFLEGTPTHMDLNALFSKA